MFMHVTQARYCGDYKVWVAFNDGAEGEIDLFSELYGELFEPLKEKELFRSFFRHLLLNLDVFTLKNGF